MWTSKPVTEPQGAWVIEQAKRIAGLTVTKRLVSLEVDCSFLQEELLEGLVNKSRKISETTVSDYFSLVACAVPVELVFATSHAGLVYDIDGKLLFLEDIITVFINEV